MPDDEVEALRRWARGDFYPLSPNDGGGDQVDRLANEMAPQPNLWWLAFKEVFAEADKPSVENLMMPFAALLDIGGKQLRAQVADTGRSDRKIVAAFWDAMNHLQLSKEAYQLLGRRMTLEAFVRHEPRIPSKPGEAWPDEWEDGWSGDALLYLSDQEPDEAWALYLELLAISADEGWIATVSAFILEDLLRDHGEAFIGRIEAEADRNERLRMGLPGTQYALSEALISRVKTAAGPYWDKKPQQ